MIRLFLFACLVGLLTACSETSATDDCGAENHCHIQDRRATCDDGYTWQDPSDVNNLTCVRRECSPPCDGCTYETDAEFCANRNATCGILSDVDSCITSRTVDCDSCPDVVDDDPSLPGSQIEEWLGGPDRFGDDNAPTPMMLPLTAVVTLTDDAEFEDCVSFDVSIPSQFEVYTGGDQWDHWFSGLIACTSPQDPAIIVYFRSPTGDFVDSHQYNTSNGYPHENCETELVVVPAGRIVVCVRRHDASSVVKQLAFGISAPVPLSEPLSATDQPGPLDPPARVLPFTETVAFDGRFDLDCFSTTAADIGYVAADLCSETDTGLNPRVVESDHDFAIAWQIDEQFDTVPCGGSLGYGARASLPVVSGQTVMVCAQASPVALEGGSGELRVSFTYTP